MQGKCDWKKKWTT